MNPGSVFVLHFKDEPASAVSAKVLASSLPVLEQRGTGSNGREWRSVLIFNESSQRQGSWREGRRRERELRERERGRGREEREIEGERGS